MHLCSIFKRKKLLRIELFARQKVEGWDVWGNEVGSTIDLTNPKAKSVGPHKERITVKKDGVDLGVYQKTFLVERRWHYDVRVVPIPISNS